MQGPSRVDPESGLGVRARPSATASSHQPAAGEGADNTEQKSKGKNTKDEDEKRETICTVVVNELDPRSVVQWPRLFAKSILRTFQVVATVRHITMGDVISGLVNTALLFTFAAVFSSAIFGEVGLTEYVALGTGCSLISTVVLQGAFTIFSDVGVNVAGPDVNPAIFIATMAGIARQSMIRNLEDQRERDRDSSVPTYAPTPKVGGHRMLAGAAHTPAPTRDQHMDMVVDPEALLATVLALIMMSSVFFGAFVYVLGRLKVSRGVQLVPGSVLGGFMASIGYLVILKALKTAIPHEEWESGPLTWDFWMFFLPAVPIGVLMYLQKRWHVGSPVVLLPIILIIPLIIFFAVTYGTGSDIEKARGQGWLFPAYSSEIFYNQFVDSYGFSQKVDWPAISTAMPTMLVMMFIVTVDSLLKQAAIRKLLKAHDLRIDHELMLLGKANVINGLLVGICGYPQPKLVAINYGVLRNTKSRVAGLIILTLHAVLFFLGFPLINYLPRFWLAGVLIFAAAGFIVENLWDARLKFSRKEYLSIWAIVIVNALFGLAWAVLAGVVLSALIFAMAYSRGGAIKAVISGSEYRSSVVRPAQDDLKLEHVGSKAVIIQLHRYVFFGSAAYVNEVIVGLIKEQDAMAAAERRAIYFIFDWAHVEDVDVTAMDVVTEMLSKVVAADDAAGGHGHGHSAAITNKSHGEDEDDSKRIVLFTGLDQRLRKKLAGENIIQLLHEPEYRGLAANSYSAAEDTERGIVGKHRRCFETLDRGMEFVEESLLERAWNIRRRWFKFDSFRDFHLRARIMLARQSFEQVLASQLGEEIWRYVEPIQVPKGWTLCRAGDVDAHLYLVREGFLTAFVEQPSLDSDSTGTSRTSRLQTLGQGAFINEDAVYVDRPIVPYTVVADSDAVVLALSREAMARLDFTHPAVAIEVHRKVLQHAARTKHKIVRMLGSLNLWDKEESRTVESQLVALPTDNGTTVSPAEEGLLSPLAEESPAPQSAGSTSGGIFGSTFGAIQGATATTLGAIQGVTATTFGAIQGVTTGVAHTTVAALQTGLIVSGFREGEGGEDKDLLDTSQLMDGAGEKSGRRFAQQFASKRRTRDAAVGPEDGASARLAGSGKNLVVSTEVLQNVKTVREFRALKLGTVGEDGEDTASAIFSLVHSSAQLVESSEVSVPDVRLRLSDIQVINARMIFARAAGAPLPRAPRGQAALQQGGERQGAGLEMPRSQVREALAQVGLTIPSSDKEFSNDSDPIPLTEGEFLNLVARLSFAPLPAEFYQRTAELFVSLTGDLNALLNEEALTAAVASSSTIMPGSVARFVLKWSVNGQRGVDYSGLCSALAQYARIVQQDERVEADWRQLCGDDETVGPEDLVRVLGLPIQVAQEMVWEADCDNNGSLSFYDILDTLTTFREGSSAWLGKGGGAEHAAGPVSI